MNPTIRYVKSISGCNNIWVSAQKVKIFLSYYPCRIYDTNRQGYAVYVPEAWSAAHN